MDNLKMQFNVIGDERGSLISLEAGKNIPFEIKRVYYIYGADPSLPRGFHAHKELQQVLVCISGSCRVVLDDAQTKNEYILDKPEKGLLVGNMVWHEMHNFSKDCVLMILASDYYNEKDYIRNLDLFIKKAVDISFVKYNEDFLSLSSKWLRDSETKELTMTPDFDETLQKKWYDSLENRDDYYIRGIVYKDIPIGVVGVKNINQDCGEYWGYIGEKEYWSKGLGKYLIKHVINYSKSINLKYLYLKVSNKNYRAIKLYRKFGFVTQFINEDIIYMIKKL